MWRALLKDVSEFSKEKVEELLVFATKGGPDMTPEMVKGSPEMLPEILKEAARRIMFCDRRRGSEPPSQQGDEVQIIKQAKITVTVQGWGSETFEVDGTRLEKLTGVADALGEKFTMVEVQDFNSMNTNIETFRRIAVHMAKQEERLVRLETLNCSLSREITREMAEIFSTLQKKCTEWKVTIFMMGSVQDDADPEEYWASLDKICNKNGHISILFFAKSQGIVSLESVRKAWEISDMLNIWTEEHQLVNLRGGRVCDCDWEGEWGLAVEALQ